MTPSRRARPVWALWLCFVSLLSVAARPPEARARRTCDYCRMIIEAPAFGATIQTMGGRTRSYDAIECMAAAVLTDSVPQRDIGAMFVVDHAAPHALLPLERATVFHCTALASPMGQHLSAFRSLMQAQAACASPDARALDWPAVLWQVNRAWFGGRYPAAARTRTHAPAPLPASTRPKPRGAK